MQPPIHLFWSRRQRNFGDEISPIVVAALANRPVVWAQLRRADMVAVGSHLQRVIPKFTRPRNKRLTIWGTGLMLPEILSPEAEVLSHVELCAVRGPLSLQFLNGAGGYGGDTVFGDPGLLIAEVIGQARTGARSGVGIVAHHSQADNPAIAGLLETVPGARLIDVGPADPTDTVRQIAACEVVISSSLHGLIVADSLHVPNLWIETGLIHPWPRLKFFDYALSVGRLLDRPVPLDEVRGLVADPDRIDTAYFDRVDAAMAALKAAFPQAVGA